MILFLAFFSLTAAVLTVLSAYYYGKGVYVKSGLASALAMFSGTLAAAAGIALQLSCAGFAFVFLIFACVIQILTIRKQEQAKKTRQQA